MREETIKLLQEKFSDIWDCEIDHRRFQNTIGEILTESVEIITDQSNIMKNNHVHLCNSCCKSYPECSDDEHAIEFGDGAGYDNICCCNRYEPILEKDVDRGGYK